MKINIKQLRVFIQEEVSSIMSESARIQSLSVDQERPPSDPPDSSGSVLVRIVGDRTYTRGFFYGLSKSRSGGWSIEGKSVPMGRIAGWLPMLEFNGDIGPERDEVANF